MYIASTAGHRFTHYQGHSVSVQEVLQLTLDFASEQSSAVRQGCGEGGGGRGGDCSGEESEAGTGEKCPRMSVGPEPRYISPEERATLEHCLRRWKAEVQEDISGKEESIYMNIIKIYQILMFCIVHCQL